MMKQIFRFLRSMRFGMILLLLIAVLCVFATALGLNAIYSSWYFITLFAMLGLNLLLCSVLRISDLKNQKKVLGAKAAQSETELLIPEPERWLESHHFRQEGDIFFSRSLGFLGPFFTHFSMLILMIAAACIFLLAQTEDIIVFPKENTVLPDGTVLYLDSFSLTDESGEIQYRSILSALLPDGSETEGEVLVNHPLKIGRYKVYQQNYAYAAVIGAKTETASQEEIIWLDEPAFLSLDDENGIYYSQIFGNVAERDGEVMVSRSNQMINPAYEVRIIDGEKDSTTLVYPGATVDAGGISFSFYDPGAYPGLRVKTQPEWTLWLLYLSFAMMLLGLYLCFFRIPEAAVVRKDGIALAGRKDISDQIERYREQLEDNS